MLNNTTNINNIEIYESDIYKYADEYNMLIKDLSTVNDKYLNKSFISMILYIHDRIGNIDINNIDLLDNIFNIFIRLCFKYNIIPTLQVFSFLVGINCTTFTEWINGRGTKSNPAYTKTTQKWFDICKNATISELNNTYGTNANMIFIAKAAYGMAETAPIQLQGSSTPILTAADIKAQIATLKDGEQTGEQKE